MSDSATDYRPSAVVSSHSVAPSKVKVPAHYFAKDDIIWIRPNGLPYWPAEVIDASDALNTVTARLFCPPPPDVVAALSDKKRNKKLPRDEDSNGDGSAADNASSSPPTVPNSAPEVDLVITSSAKRVFFFDKLNSEAELVTEIESRLNRRQHDVSQYEFRFVEAVRKANSLVRISLTPARLQPFEVCGVGVVHSFMRTHTSAPRQPSTKEFSPQTAVILLRPGLENAVRDLKGFERIWVVFHFSYAVGLKPHEREGSDAASGWKTMIVPPRDTVQRGVFATRSPHRPNSIGLSCVKLVDVRGLEVHIADHDLLHGTPVLDIKPYLPFCDAHPHAKAGWVQDLDERGAGLGDHRAFGDGVFVHRNFEAKEEDGTQRTRHA